MVIKSKLPNLRMTLKRLNQGRNQFTKTEKKPFGSFCSKGQRKPKSCKTPFKFKMDIKMDSNGNKDILVTLNSLKIYLLLDMINKIVEHTRMVDENSMN